MRTPSASDFLVPVEGVGDFVFGKRKLADEVKVQVEYARLTEGVVPTPWLHLVCSWLSALKVLCVRAPDGFDIDELDPLEPDTYEKLQKVSDALAAKEGSFRSGARGPSQSERKGTGEDAGVLVP